MPEKIGVAVCSHFFPELKAAVRHENWSYVVPMQFPALCGKPPMTQEGLSCLTRQDNSCTFIHVLGGCCCKKLSVDLPTGEAFKLHVFNPCFAMLTGETFIQSLCDAGAYLLSPGWLAIWREKLRSDGFDQNSARQFYGESLKSLELLDTGIDQRSGILLQEFGNYLDLPFHTTNVGLDHFRLLLRNILESHELGLAHKAAEAALKEARGRIAEFSMMSDVLTRLAQVNQENDALASVVELIQTLFAPGQITYLKWMDGIPAGEVTCIPSRAGSEVKRAHERLAAYSTDYGKTEDGNGFFLRFTHRREIMAIVELQEIAFPKNIDRYINTSLSFISAVGMAIANIRAFARLDRQFRDNQRLLETIQEDIDNAGEIQRSLLPKHEERFPSLDISWYFRPCTTIGGDLLNIFQLDREHVVFYMFDVSGHGVQAAMSGVSVHEMLSSFRVSDITGQTVSEALYRPKEIAGILNDKFGARKRSYFTLTYGVINIVTGIVKYIRAGHTPLLVKEASGSLQILSTGDTPVGMFPGTEFEEHEIRLSPGDRLIIYSDGITEARRFPAPELYGEERLYATIYATDKLKIKDCVSEIVADLMKWLGEIKPNDDISLLAIDMLPDPTAAAGLKS